MSIEGKKLAERIVAFRRKHGLSQSSLATALEVSRNYVSMVEGGRDPGRKFKERFEALEIESEQQGTVELAANPRKKLAFALSKRGMSPAELSQKIGYDAGVIANVVHGRGRASERMIENIVRELPELSKDDLIEGSEHVPILSVSGSEGSYGAKPEVILPPGMDGRMLPLLSNAEAGAWDAGHTDEGWDGKSIFVPNVRDRRAFAIRVVGNSMEPDIREGDVVVCSPAQEIRSGLCAVVRTKSEQAFIKFWRKHGDTIILESANPDYEPLKFPESEIAGAWPVIQRIAYGPIKKEEK